jgi:cytochrome c oxidase cbb3-type subunit III
MTARRRRSLAAAACLATAIAGCDWMPGRPMPADRPLTPAEVTDFATLYGDNCAGCHGRDGTLGAALPLNNPVYLALADDSAMRKAIAQGVPGTAMPPFANGNGGSLTDAQIDLIIAGMRQRWAQPEALDTSAPSYSAEGTGNPDQGGTAYSEYCESCHGPDGKGGDRAGSIVDPAYLSLVSDQALRTLIIAGRPDLGHPDWRTYVAGKPLGSQQVSDLVAWIAAKRPAVSADLH